MARRRKARLVPVLLPVNARLLASRVIARYREEYNVRGSEWASRYQTNIGQKYLADPERVKEAEENLGYWYLALAENKHKIRSAFNEIKMRYDELRATRPTIPVTAPAPITARPVEVAAR